jgi:hypothetical protein
MKLLEYQTTKPEIDLIRLESYHSFIKSISSDSFIYLNMDDSLMNPILKTLHNKIVLLCTPDADFPFPLPPYFYDAKFDKALLPKNYEEIDYYKKIDHEIIDIIEKNNLYVVNVAISLYHPRLLTIPFGAYNKFNHMHLRTTKKDILCYMNMGFTPDRWFGNPRRVIFNYMKHKSFVVHENCDEHLKRNRDSMDSFYNQIARSKFTICPRGCGIDTPRLWDCLYLGCIPIVDRYKSHESFSDLPILFMDSYEDFNSLTEEYLEMKYKEFLEKEFDYKKLSMNYWIHRIKSLEHLLSPKTES